MVKGSDKRSTGTGKSDSSPANPIGRRLKQLRKEHDWTLAEVAHKTGISVGTLSKLEHGKTDLNFSSVNKLANGLGLPVTDLTNPASGLQGRRAITMGGQGAIGAGNGQGRNLFGRKLHVVVCLYKTDKRFEPSPRCFFTGQTIE